jgi:aminotransferase
LTQLTEHSPDETYDFLVYDDVPFFSLTSFPEIKEQIVACYSFSKQYAMTGWRVGYMYAPSPIIDQALKVHDAVVISAPTISQYAALAALTHKVQSSAGEEIREILARRRALVCSRLERLMDLFSFVKPDGAYYVLPRYLKTELNSTDFSMKLLHEAKVITVPGRAFGPNGESHIRLSYGGTEEEINLAFDRIEL